MRNWHIDGWSETDWDNLTSGADDLRAIAREFDNAVGGGGGFEPTELAQFAARLHAAANRIKRISESYL